MVAWMPGPTTREMPALGRLGPEGSVDAVPGGGATFRVASVIPDSVKSPGPQPAVGPLRLDRSSPIPVVAAALLAGDVLVLLIAWKRRGPRVLAAGAGVAGGAGGAGRPRPAGGGGGAGGGGPAAPPPRP